MLYGILVSIFAALCIFLVLIILVQKGKSSMGLGSLGGGNQILFGGSGGQDVFQKTTWVLGTIFMAGSLVLAMLKKPTEYRILTGIKEAQPQKEIAVPKQPMPTPESAPKTEQKQAMPTQPEAK